MEARRGHDFEVMFVIKQVSNKNDKHVAMTLSTRRHAHVTGHLGVSMYVNNIYLSKCSWKVPPKNKNLLCTKPFTLFKFHEHILRSFQGIQFCLQCFPLKKGGCQNG